MGAVLSDCARGGASSVSRDREVLICRPSCLDGVVGGLEPDDDGRSPRHERTDRMEGLLRELFRLHDLNGNGLLEEVELVKLNEKIAILHCGVSTDRSAVRKRYSGIFRNRLNPKGQPATYAMFRHYMLEILDGLDPDEPTQSMIMGQLIAEADLALAAFPNSLKIRPGQLAKLPGSPGDAPAVAPDAPAGSSASRCREDPSPWPRPVVQQATIRKPMKQPQPQKQPMMLVRLGGG